MKRKFFQLAGGLFLSIICLAALLSVSGLEKARAQEKSNLWQMTDNKEILAQPFDQGITDPRVMAIKIIQIMLAFVAIICLFLIIYAGFTWMTAGGEEEKVNKAKKTIKYALSGVVVIIFSYYLLEWVVKIVNEEIFEALP